MTVRSFEKTFAEKYPDLFDGMVEIMSSRMVKDSLVEFKLLTSSDGRKVYIYLETDEYVHGPTELDFGLLITSDEMVKLARRCERGELSHGIDVA